MIGISNNPQKQYNAINLMRADHDHRYILQEPLMRGEGTAPNAIAPPNSLSTFLLLCGLALTAWLLDGQTASEVAGIAAFGVGASLVAAILVDLQTGWENIFRADIMAMCALYFLTLAEFLVPQPNFDQRLQNYEVVPAVIATLWGYAGLAIGRHLRMSIPMALQTVLGRPAPRHFLINVFWAAFLLGSLHMLVTVGFNPIRMVTLMLQPRFAQPWSRGRLGDWHALLYEIGALLYLVPPLAGVILARRREYPAVHLATIVFGFVFVLFQGFSNGTRNVFASYLVTAAVGYCYGLPRRRRKEAIVLAVLCLFALLISTQVMLDFRRVGLSSYIQNEARPGIAENDGRFFVDYNLRTIAGLVREIPKTYDYVGVELPYFALIHPIPRAIWTEKPEGLRVSVERIMGVERQGLTLAATFVGEGYMAGGMIVVFLVGCFFGLAARWWGELANTFSSQVGIFIYASGFFAIVISMRSVLWFTVAILPPLAGIAAAMAFARRGPIIELAANPPERS